ncbi:MAG: efflux RND transporter periplasmic adaptor subunit [Rhodoferax sp.]|uniref:efflux RND transporter periplasmic adaptor subunit n=1 Tax=Rhodoferax sp. TaxID=50421 RepID=UPI001B713047|nr:efflux RND transporter periplasmic adaptor subunit [Rhodoferax sp.]MBP9906513.1 efflux RND transporter periplasmic adaptor subunit [Rhodoferax sp.]
MNRLKLRTRCVGLGLTIAAACLLVACTKPEAPAEPIRSVKVVTVGLQRAQAGLEYAAEVRARVESRLGFRVAGKLIERPAELGQRVRAGQVLARLDAQDLKLAADAARAQVAAALTNRDLAAADFKRYESLRAQNFISGAELERRDTTLKAAQAQLQAAQAQSTAQGNQSSYATLSADASGIITAVLAEPGQVLSAGTPVLQLAQDGARDAVFAVPEDKLAALRLGAPALVRSWSSNSSVNALVREVAASADPVTRTFAVKVALPAGSDWPLGSTVTVLPAALQHTGAQVIKLPTNALRQEGQGTAVWILDSATMTVKSQSVQVATADGNEVVISAGLQPGMQVVVAGVHVLSPGQKVTLYKEKQPPALTSQAQTATNAVASSAATGARAAASN